MIKILLKLSPLGLLTLFGLIAIAATIFFYVFLTANTLQAAPDFYVQYHATQVAFSGKNPYSDAATLETQLYLFGAPLPPNEDQEVFVSSFFSLYLSAPLALLPYQFATAIFMGLLFAGNFVGTLLLLDALDWQASPLANLGITLVVLTAAPFVTCLFLGQWAAVVYALFCLLVWSLKRGFDTLAGVALALSTIKPTLAVLVVAGCMVWGLWHRRIRFVAAFGLTMLPLLAASFWQQPNWLSELFRVTSLYRTFKVVLTGPEFLFEGLPGGVVLAWLLWLILAGWLVYSWYLALRGGSEALIFALALTMAMTLLLLPQTNVVNPIILMLPFLVAVRPLAKLNLPWLPLAALVGVLSWYLYAVAFKVAYGWSLITLPFLVLLFMINPFLKLRKNELSNPKSAKN